MAQLPSLLRNVSRGCFHRRVGWPLRNRQRCLSCGSWRVYDLNRDLRGNWNDPELPHLESFIVLKESDERSPGMEEHWVDRQISGRRASDVDGISHLPRFG